MEVDFRNDVIIDITIIIIADIGNVNNYCLKKGKERLMVIKEIKRGIRKGGENFVRLQ